MAIKKMNARISHLVEAITPHCGKNNVSTQIRITSTCIYGLVTAVIKVDDRKVKLHCMTKINRLDTGYSGEYIWYTFETDANFVMSDALLINISEINKETCPGFILWNPNMSVSEIEFNVRNAASN